jgi:hypothetical protein
MPSRNLELRAGLRAASGLWPALNGGKNWNPMLT